MTPLTGTSSQIEWATQIRLAVDVEFTRVASAFEAVAIRQTGLARTETQSLIAIVEEKRAETMDNDHAGYFIRDGRELNDQGRQLIFRDPRYKAIAADRAARRRKS